MTIFASSKREKNTPNKTNIMADIQEHTYSKIATRQSRKCLCLHPRKVVNPRVVEFILTHEATFFFSQSNVHLFNEPSFGSCMSTKQYKKCLSERIRSLLHRCDDIDCFFDANGDSVDAYILVPCNHCIVCLYRKSVAFASKCSMECQSHKYLPLFITLTYSDEKLPPCGLRYSDVQLFLKRLRISLQRKHNFTGKLVYAACGEYGSHTNRPHYHLLLWNFPRDGYFSNYFNIDKFIRQCWTNGLTQTKQCRDTEAGFYVGKYMTKDESDSPNKVKPMKRTSKFLGVDFVKSVAEPVLRKNPSQSSIQYKDRFDGSLHDLPLTSYYVNVLFPTFNKLSCDVRNSLRDILLTKNIYLLHSMLDCQDIELLKLSNPYNFSRYMSDSVSLPDIDLSVAVFHLSQYAGKQIPNFLDNERVKSFHTAMLFHNLPDVEPEQLAYQLEKQFAKNLDKEIF